MKKPRKTRDATGPKPADSGARAKDTASPASTLKGWKAIAEFLAIPSATAQRWAKGGMPVRREGRLTVAEAEELRGWLGRESEMPAPAHIATNNADLAAGLKESIAAVRSHKRE